MSGKQLPVFLTPVTYGKEHSDASAMFPVGESLTVQAMSEDADINVLMRRYGITGKMPENPRVPQYGDFTGITDYASAVNAVLAADDAFMELTPEVRARFQNSPQELMVAASTPGNEKLFEELGLMKAKPPASAPAAPAAPVSAPAPAAPAPPTAGTV